MADYSTLLRDHVKLTCRSIDRIFLQAYVPKLRNLHGTKDHLISTDVAHIYKDGLPIPPQDSPFGSGALIRNTPKEPRAHH
jgi:hypothetical protein